MTWHKKVDVMGPPGWSISVSTTDGVDGILVNVVSPAGYVHLTPNQAGDLAHALGEAIQHAQEALK